MTRQQLLESARQLSDEDRAQLVEDLIDSLPPDALSWDSDEDLLQEVKRRMNDGAPLISWEVVREHLDGRTDR